MRGQSATLAFLATVLGLTTGQTFSPGRACNADGDTGSIFDYSYPLIDGDTAIDFETYRGKLLMVQEPGATPEEILNGVTYVRPGNGFTPNFPLFRKNQEVWSKIDVNGENEEAMYTWLKSVCPPTNPDFFAFDAYSYGPNPNMNDVRWNFEKFLIDFDGKPYMRFDATTFPDTSVITDAIDELLAGRK
ncbi:unnamed protein product [Cyprideis torosa]|uniref:Glutathione peroxidase n=1 Tax=Cyprideis torosa TaxID=163714 RepID=A0A7R8WAS3_9CRUS|nr:unnamed protein product [Cyprideis torosa]CAG0891406.1 unnamed protein product [Cyprideis torosa]